MRVSINYALCTICELSENSIGWVVSKSQNVNVVDSVHWTPYHLKKCWIPIKFKFSSFALLVLNLIFVKKCIQVCPKISKIAIPVHIQKISFSISRLNWKHGDIWWPRFHWITTLNRCEEFRIIISNVQRCRHVGSKVWCSFFTDSTRDTLLLFHNLFDVSFAQMSLWNYNYRNF